jgi:hypothetical protein
VYYYSNNHVKKKKERIFYSVTLYSLLIKRFFTVTRSRNMASAPQLELEKQEGVPVSEDGTFGHQAEKAKATLKEQEADANLYESSVTQNVVPGQNLLGHQDSAQPGIRPGDAVGKAGGTSA